MKKSFFLLGLIFWVLPSVFSFNCRFVGVDQKNCIILNNVSEDLIASIIYKNSSIPDYYFISNYNSAIIVSSPPDNTTIISGKYIKDAWIKILTIQPSIILDNLLYIPENYSVRTAYSYNIVLPNNYSSNSKYGICSITYNLENEHTILNNYNNFININSYADILTEYIISVSIKAVEKHWIISCNGHCYKCVYYNTYYYPETIIVNDSIRVRKYISNIRADASIINEYYNTTKIILNILNNSIFILRLDNSSYIESRFIYNAVFINRPYYMLQLQAIRQNSSLINNLVVSDGILYAPKSISCYYIYEDFFNNYTKNCIKEINDSVTPIIITSFSDDWYPLLAIIILFIILYLLYSILKSYWKKYLVFILAGILFVPVVRADDCGLTNLATCIPQKFYEYFLSFINSPLQPLLTFIKNLFVSPPSIALFGSVWAIIVYLISIFYTFLFLYAGFQFLVSGHNVVQREMAKEWLKNTVIMIVLIQASYYLYGLVVDIGSTLTSAILSMVDSHFFMLTVDNISNSGLELIFTSVYLIVLLITVLLLVVRYMVVAFGVIFIPIGIFCYFIPPLRSYGRLIINIIGMFIFITFLDAIIILASSMLISISLFQDFKILVMITCLIIINLLIIILTKHVITKTGISESGEKFAAAINYIGMIG